MYIPRFNGLGGTTRLYGGINVRPSRSILNRWPLGWRYDDLLPFYKKIEDHFCYYYSSNETGISNENCLKYHGKNGPLQVNPTYIPEFANISLMFQSICKDQNQMWKGFNSDLNGENHLGCSLFHRFYNRKGNRTDVHSDFDLGTSFHSYFNSTVLQRTNLRIRSATLVKKILFDENVHPPRAFAIRIENSSGEYLIYVKKELILAGGTFSTPRLLQISGIGDEKYLQSINIQPVATNIHLGQNLRDHISVPMIFQVKNKSSTYPNYPNQSFPFIYQKSIPNGSKSWLIALNTRLRQENITDIQIYFSDTNIHSPDNFQSKSPRKCRFGSNGHQEGPLAEIILRLILQDPSFLGTIVPLTNSIRDKPKIDLNWKNISDYEYQVFQMTFDRIRQLISTSEWGNLIENEVYPGKDLNERDFINAHVESALHPISTCQMGLCCDTQLRLINVSNIRLSDASAFGGQIDANPSATIFALAERLFHFIQKDYGFQSIDTSHKVSNEHRSRSIASGQTISSNIIETFKDYSQIFPDAS